LWELINWIKTEKQKTKWNVFMWWMVPTFFIMVNLPKIFYL
jgi:hypothetical protein